MSDLISREVHLVTRPEGIPVPENFTLVEEKVSPPQEGQVLVQNIYMSVDPAMRPPMTTTTKMRRARIREPSERGLA